MFEESKKVLDNIKELINDKKDVNVNDLNGISFKYSESFSIYSEEEKHNQINIQNMLDEYSIKNQDLDISLDSIESEFPNPEETIHIKLIYDKNKFISCPEEMNKKWKFFYQHDLDKLLLSEKFTKPIFEKAWNVSLADQKILPHLKMDDLHKVRHKLKLYSYIPIYNPATVNRQWCSRFNVPLHGKIDIDKANIHMPTLLLFNSRFESGNLERAYKIEDAYRVQELNSRKSALTKNQNSVSNLDIKLNNWVKSPEKLEARYELYITPDYGISRKQSKDGEYTRYGLSKHTQWFYFSTKNFSTNLKAKFAIK